MSQSVSSIAIIGCGIHFRSRYFEVIEVMCRQGLAQVAVVIDLESQEQIIRGFFKERDFVVSQYVFLPELLRNDVTVNHLVELIDKNYVIEGITHAVISTEPKVHKTFILWALEHNWHIFTDKPLTAFSCLDKADTLFDDYNEIMQALHGKNLTCVISCERRYHEGYQYLYKYIAAFIQKYKIPITFIDINFAGGKWVLPNELALRENHPYKYGYGELLHSGYHYIDLLTQLLSFNKILFDYDTDELDLHVLTANPFNALHELNKNFYQHLFNSHRFDSFFSQDNRSKFKYYGEVDVLLTGRVKKDDKIFTNFSLKLINSSVSLRHNFSETDDQYAQDEGRIRQENVIIHLGPLCSIHIKSNPYSKMCAHCYEEDFAISIMNNPTIVDEKPLIQLKRAYFSETFLGKKMSMNIMSRRKQLFDFLHGKTVNSSFTSHKDSIALLTRIYKLIKQQAQNED